MKSLFIGSLALLSMVAVAVGQTERGQDTRQPGVRPGEQRGSDMSGRDALRMTPDQARDMCERMKVNLADSIKNAEKHVNGRAVAAYCSHETVGMDERTVDRNKADRDGNIADRSNATGTPPICVVTVLLSDNTFSEVRVNAESGEVIGQRRLETIGMRTERESVVRSGENRGPRDDFGPPGRWQKAEDLMGKSVVNSANENLGTVNDIVVDANSGRIIYAVVSYGGFMGLGDKWFAVPWPSLRLAADAKHFVLDVDRERLKSAEGFNKEQWPNFADERWATATYQHYGQKPYWTSSSTGDTYRDRWTQRVVLWQKASDLTGKDVKSASNEDLGDMVDLAIDPDAGRIIYGILSFNGKLFAVPWNATRMSNDVSHFVINVNKATLRDNVAFSNDRWPDLTDSRWALETHSVFNVRPYWSDRDQREDR